MILACLSISFITDMLIVCNFEDPDGNDKAMIIKKQQ